MKRGSTRYPFEHTVKPSEKVPPQKQTAAKDEAQKRLLSRMWAGSIFSPLNHHRDGLERVKRGKK